MKTETNNKKTLTMKQYLDLIPDDTDFDVNTYITKRSQKWNAEYRQEQVDFWSRYSMLVNYDNPEYVELTRYDEDGMG